jgi:Zn-dependent peptidase ImmA (M78 family)
MTDIVKQASIAAERIRFDHWGDKVPVDPARIASSLGIEVVEAHLDADVAGAIQREPGKQTTIFLSAGDHPNRKRFTCAHEIGHFEKRGGGSEALGYIDYRDEAASMGTYEDERFANAFAAALLMPELVVERLHTLGAHEEEMAQRFGVSQAAMVNRLKNLDLYRP